MRTLILVATLVITFAVIVSSQTPPPLLAAPTAATTPQQPKSDYQPLRERTGSQGSISNRGRSWVNAIETPLGRYQKMLYDAIGSRWYLYVVEKTILLNIGTAQVTFWVDPSGRVNNLKIIKNTSNEAFANVCLQSILEVHLPPIPADVAALLPPKGLDEKITFTMFPTMQPESKTATTARAKLEHAILTVSENDEIKLDGKKIAVDDLADAFRHLSAIQRACLVLQADKKASSGIIVKVMDALKLSGVKRSADIHSGDQK
jgi:hypothetical protein